MGDDVANDKDLEDRLKRLSQDLGKADGRGASQPGAGSAGPSDEMIRARAAGFRMLGEFVAAIVVGCVIGYAIDRAAGTSPGFLIAFLILGTVAGFYNIWRAAAPPGARPRN